MFLTATNIAHYLLARGRVEPSTVVDGDFLVAEMGRRNRNFKVISADAPSLFVKQVKNGEPQAQMTLRREAECYRLAQSDPAYEALAKLMPRFVDYDARRHVLMVEALDEAVNLTEYQQRLKAFPVSLGKILGEALGSYHSQLGSVPPKDEKTSAFPRAVPWILYFHRSNPAGFSQMSQGNAALLATLNKHPDFTAHLDRLYGGWRINGLIHGDMKWDNCLLLGEGDDQRLTIVDWELADFGDLAWDAGAVFQNYLTYWVLSMPLHEALPAEQMIRSATIRLEDMQPAMRAFWRSYCDSRGLQGAEAQRELLRCCEYAAARMVQTAYEYLTYSPRMSNGAAVLLQLSLNTLSRPQRALGELLGF